MLIQYMRVILCCNVFGISDLKALMCSEKNMPDYSTFTFTLPQIRMPRIQTIITIIFENYLKSLKQNINLIVPFSLQTNNAYIY